MSNLKRCYDNMRGILGPAYQEPFEAVKTVEEYRVYWKPKKIKIILLAESHVYTTLEDYKEKDEKIRFRLPKYPRNYVRFIYCLNYGGTRQFWRIFYSALNFVESNKKFRETNEFNNKLKILYQMKERGIWLVDASICGLYIPGGKKPNSTKIKKALDCSWNGYVKNVIESSNPEKMVVIGKTIWDAIRPFLSPEFRSKTEWVYQPNARLAGKGHIKNYQKLHQICNPENAERKYTYSKNQNFSIKIKNELPNNEKLKVTYKYTRLCFLAEMIEPLNSKESFRIICSEGIFQMTKEEFYREFQNVIQSRSYSEKGVYHYPKPPHKAFRFLIKNEEEKN